MSDGSDNGVDYYPTGPAPAGETGWKPPSDSAYSPSSPSGEHGADSAAHCGGILDLGGLIGGPGSVVDVEAGQGDGHTAAVLDVVLGGEDTASVSLLGQDILGAGDILGTCGLIGGTGSLVDVDFGQSDGHTAAVLDVVLGGDDTAGVSLLGSEILGGEGILGGGDSIGTCGMLDGLLDHGCLLG